MAEAPVADVLAVGMLAVAIFCAGRLVLAAAWRRTNERDVDAVHVVMGVSMAGMLTGWLTGAWNDAWVAVFAVSTIWFGSGVVRHLSARSFPTTGGGHLPHFVTSAAMLYMLFAMGSTAMGGGMHAMAGATRSPMLEDALIAVLLVGNAVISAGQALIRVEPASARLAAVRAPAAGGSGLTPDVEPASIDVHPVRGAATLAPRATPVCLVVMSVAMAYMFITIRP
jgi:Domain of unknown function (DUF5134)